MRLLIHGINPSDPETKNLNVMLSLSKHDSGHSGLNHASTSSA